MRRCMPHWRPCIPLDQIRQELVEEMGPAHPSGSEERVFNVCDALAVEVAFPFPPLRTPCLPSFCSYVAFKFFHHLSSDGKFSPCACFSIFPLERASEGGSCFGAHSSTQAYFIAVYAVPFELASSKGAFLCKGCDTRQRTRLRGDIGGLSTLAVICALTPYLMPHHHHSAGGAG